MPATVRVGNPVTLGHTLRVIPLLLAISRTARSAVPVFVLLPLLLAACDPASNEVASTTTAAPAQAPRVPLVVLGLDAGDWTLLGPWMDRGLLPNLARIRAAGVHGKLRSTEISSSPVIWTSIATGKVPEKTGITWFVRFPHGPGKPVPVDRRQLKTSTLWDIFTRRRIDVAVLGWYVTWPAAEVYGRLLSDLSHFGRLNASRWPPEYLWDLATVSEEDAVRAMPRFMDFTYDRARAVRKEGEPPSLDFLVYDRFIRAWSRDRFYFDAANRVLSDGPLPETFFVYLRGTDDVQHGFWKFMDPEAFKPRMDASGKPVAGTTEVSPQQVAAFGKVIERYWQWIDEEVGRILEHYAKTTPLVIVCSDHGAGPATGEAEVGVPEYLHLSGSHRVDGIVLASGPGIRRPAGTDAKRGIEITGATIYDIAPTILHALGLPLARDMDGKVLTAMFDERVAARPAEWIDTYDTQKPETAVAPEMPDDVDRQVLEQLRSLGYIGQ